MTSSFVFNLISVEFLVSLSEQRFIGQTRHRLPSVGRHSQLSEEGSTLSVNTCQQMDFNSRPNSADSLRNSNHFYHHSSPQQHALSPPGSHVAPVDPNIYANNEYMNQYSLYVQNYYREYYRQWLQTHSGRQHASNTSVSSAPTLRQPLKYGSRRSHARAVFSQHNNDVMIVDNTSVGARSVRIYALRDLFVDYLFPSQMFHILLREDNNELPFASKEAALQWIRCKQELTSGTTTDFELKLVLRVIQMLLKQNSRITGLDLSGK